MITWRNNLIEEFLDAKEYGEGVALHTVKEYRKDMELFFVFIEYSSQLIGIKELKELYGFIKTADISSISLEQIKNLKEREINQYLKFLTVSLDNGTSTKNRRLSCLKAFFKFSHKTYRVDDIMRDKKLLKKQKGKLPKYLSEEEAELLVGALKHDCNFYRNKLILSIALNAGLRVEEIKNLTTDNVTNYELTFIGKGNVLRTVPMNETLKVDYMEYLEYRKTDTKELFLIDIRSIQRVVKSAVKAIDRPELSIHGLRHTFATRLMKKGVDIETIGELMGHADITSTQVYFHTNIASKTQAVATLDF